MPLPLYILILLADGPVRLQALAQQMGISWKRVYVQVHALHRSGTIRRLGKNGAAWWALKSYHGPRPATIRRFQGGGDRVKPAGTLRVKLIRPKPANSWWAVPVTREAFQQLAHQRAQEMGWDA